MALTPEEILRFHIPLILNLFENTGIRVVPTPGGPRGFIMINLDVRCLFTFERGYQEVSGSLRVYQEK